MAATARPDARGNGALERNIRAAAEPFRGELIFPDDGRYDEARMVWNQLFDRRPAVVGRCRDRDDVVTLLGVARDHELLVAVRSGGHSYAGNSTCDGGLVVDLSRMNEVTVDADRRLATVGPGATWGRLNDAAGKYGLAGVGGDVSNVGVAGLTLGGGIGWLSRTYGLACDNVVEFELVTASGSVVRANADEHAELYWALRGGGGNFGVVTRFTLRLHPVGSVFGGVVMYSAERADQVLRSLMEFSERASDSVRVMAGLLTAPPEPFVPDDLQGRPAVLLGACHVGSESAGERELAPLLEFADPRVDTLAPMSFAQLQHMFDATVATPMPVYMRAELLGHVDHAAVDAMVEAASQVPNQASNVILLPLGGAVRSVPSQDTAFAHRDAEWDMAVGGAWLPADDAEACRRWADATWERMRPWSVGVEINHLRDDGTARVRDAYPERTYARLSEIKRRYDPDNVFRLNHNIEPA